MTGHGETVSSMMDEKAQIQSLAGRQRAGHVSPREFGCRGIELEHIRPLREALPNRLAASWRKTWWFCARR